MRKTIKMNHFLKKTDKTKGKLCVLCAYVLKKKTLN